MKTREGKMPLSINNTYVKIALTIIIFLIFIIVYMEYNSKMELNHAREELSKGNFEDAAYGYFKSINYYSPIGSSQTAANELMDLGIKLENDGAEREAYLTFLRLRGAILASRSFYIPRKDLLRAANSHIANYLARLKEKENPNGFDLKAQRDYYYILYMNSPPSGEFWYFIAVGGFLLWTFSAIFAIFKIFSKKNFAPLALRIKPAKYPICLFFLGYALWLIGMAVA
jgi:hypothetical protein